MLTALLLAVAAATMPAGASAAVDGAAETLRRIPAPEARQGVAVGPKDIYAIANYRIARYDKRTGESAPAGRERPSASPTSTTAP